MSLIFNTKTYTADSFEKDQVGYIGAAKTLSLKDDLRLARAPASPSALFSGQARTDVKLTRTLNLTNAKTLTGDAIIKLQVYTPVGCSNADVDTLLDDFGALVQGADAKTAVKSQKISF